MLAGTTQPNLPNVFILLSHLQCRCLMALFLVPVPYTHSLLAEEKYLALF